MAKWIDIKIALPKKSGSYLVCDIPFKSSIIERWDYNSLKNEWKFSKDYAPTTLTNGFWWDEYSHTEEKKTIKLKFQTNG